MKTEYKPTGYSSVSPYLIVSNAKKTLDFLQTVMAAEVMRRFEEDGRVVHSEARIDDSVVMIADATEQWPAIRANVHVYVPEVDETYRKAIEFGCKPVQEPAQKEDEDKRGGIEDPGGTTWWIATKKN